MCNNENYNSRIHNQKEFKKPLLTPLFIVYNSTIFKLDFSISTMESSKSNLLIPKKP